MATLDLKRLNRLAKREERRQEEEARVMREAARKVNDWILINNCQ